MGEVHFLGSNSELKIKTIYARNACYLAPGDSLRSIGPTRLGEVLMPVKIFCCYAHEDEPLLNKLKTHLSPLQRQDLIDIWHDRDISPGTEWEQEVRKH